MHALCNRMDEKALFKENENKLANISNLEKICENGEIREYVFTGTCDLRVANFTYSQRVKPMILVTYLLGEYFRSRAATYVLNLAERSGICSNVFFLNLFFFYSLPYP